jgi:hypothetical protein
VRNTLTNKVVFIAIVTLLIAPVFNLSSVQSSISGIRNGSLYETEPMNYEEHVLSLQGNWLEGWEFRKKHTIYGSQNASENYQVEIVVNYGAGTDYSNYVYCYKECQPTFLDIRFTLDDGLTLLPFWKSTFVSGDYAVFWVAISESLSSDRDIYVYYGNVEAEDISDGRATFPLFDDFNRENSKTVGQGWWEAEGGYSGDTVDADVDIYNNVLKIAQEMRQYAHIERRAPVLNEFVLQTSFKVSPNCGDDWAPRIHLYWGTFNWIGFGIGNGPNLQIHQNLNTAHSIYEHPALVYSEWCSLQLRLANSTISAYCSADGENWYLIKTLPRPEAWSNPPYSIIIGKGYSRGNGYYTIGHLKNSMYDGYSGERATHYFDDVFIRKYTSSEPKHGTWGEREPFANHISEVLVNMTTIVGLSGNSYMDAMNLLAASQLGFRYQDGTLAKSLVIPDVISNYQTPLDEWISALGDSTDELVIVGDINETNYINRCNPRSINRINSANFYSTAADLTNSYFSLSDTVVLAYAHPNPVNIIESVSLFSESNTLPAPIHAYHSIATTPSSYEDNVYVTRAGGGIVAYIKPRSYFIYQLGYQKDGESFGLDYPWYGDGRMAYPYFGESGTWRFNFIDTYPSSRSCYFGFDTWTLPKNEYHFTIAENETCNLDFHISVSNASQSVGLYVLDPDMNIVVDVNRFALIRDDFNETTASATLSYPRPGNYIAYVTTPELSGANYSIEITKHTINPTLIDSGLSSSNALALAALHNSGVLFSDGVTYITDAINSIAQHSPEKLIVVDIGNHFSGSFLDSLTGLATEVVHITNTKQLYQQVSNLPNEGERRSSIAIYEPVGEYFVDAAISASSRLGIALPIGCCSSQFMTYSHAAEQMAYHADYTYPFIGGYHYYNIFTSSASVSELHPSYDSMTQITVSFDGWLENVTGSSSADVLIVIAPYREMGTTLPPAFDRAVMGKSLTGRYPSTSMLSTYCQIMQSALRIPLLSTKPETIQALGSHVAYNYGDPVATNGKMISYFDTSGDFTTLEGPFEINLTQQAGPSTITHLQGGALFWLLSSHGGIGESMYSDDGVLALMDFDCWRGYDTGQNTESPDDGDGAVNPTDDLEYYNITDIIGNTDLHGLITYFDTCQLGSSYGPALMLESGAESVVACWLDSYIGPSDLLEWNVLTRMIQGDTIADALIGGFSINSHLYSQDKRGDNYYISDNTLRAVSATSNQFVVFGNPTAALSDSCAAVPPVVRLTNSVTPSPYLVTAGQTVEVPIGVGDIFRQPLNTTSVDYIILDPNSDEYQSGALLCDENFMAYAEVIFPESCELGQYLVFFDRPLDSQIYSFYIEVVLPTPLYSSTDGTIADTISIELGLLTHSQEILDIPNYEYEIRDDMGILIHDGNVACNSSHIATVSLLIDPDCEAEYYEVTFNVEGSPNTYHMIIYLELPQVLHNTFEIHTGEWLIIELGLVSNTGYLIESDSYAYTITYPSGSVFLEGSEDCNNEYIACVNVAVPLTSIEGNYTVRFRIPGTERLYEATLIVIASPITTTPSTTTPVTTTTSPSETTNNNQPIPGEIPFDQLILIFGLSIVGAIMITVLIILKRK